MSSPATQTPAGCCVIRWRRARAGIRITIGGNTVPVPALDLLPGWDKAGTIIDYVCEGDTLKLKPQVAGLKNDWQHLKRVP
jgi:hypothetical protein